MQEIEDQREKKRKEKCWIASFLWPLFCDLPSLAKPPDYIKVAILHREIKRHLNIITQIVKPKYPETFCSPIRAAGREKWRQNVSLTDTIAAVIPGDIRTYNLSTVSVTTDLPVS